METASIPAMRSKSVVAVNRPAFTIAFTCREGTSLMWERPALRAAAFSGTTSNPVTRNPARQNSMARGSPT